LTPRTHLLAQDAQRRGLAALIVQARAPWQLLRRCAEVGARAILSHRLHADQPAGHYSVLVGVTEDGIVRNDPLLGPDTAMTREQFLRLWAPAWPPLEVVGHIAVIVAAAPGPQAACPRCQAALPAFRGCRRCRERIPLQPGATLGCLSRSCPERLWE